ncbi:MAG: oxidoreductase [Candidatus Firestonebacteria bacterium RIFOXYA2_FULL_40_8]|nr:MAG: oxidoreductase [Candidatus Firestonebacteria bacterium RIFOXYA2_FULL_40_8]
MKKAIIIGASSGIGRELAKIFASNGYEVGIVARRTGLLDELKAEMTVNTYTAAIDITNTDIVIRSLEYLIKEMSVVDIVVISAGIGYINPELDWSKDKETIDTNVSGFAAIAGTAMKYFAQKKSGHLVGISSIAGIRGSNECSAYNASKAFMSNYLEGLRKKSEKEKMDITITDIQPGLVDTAMAKGEGLFWVAPPKKAAKQIYKAILKKKKKAYITKRWAIIAWVLKIIPDFIYNKI